MDFLPKELSFEQANVMKNILDQQITLIQAERKENQDIKKVFNNQLPSYQENSKETKGIQSEIQLLQSKIQDLEERLLSKGDEQYKEEQKEIYNKKVQSQQSSRDNSLLTSHRAKSRSKSRQIREAALKRIENQEQFLGALERSFSISFHSQVSNRSNLSTSRKSQKRTKKGQQQSSDNSFTNLNSVEKIKQELAQERSKRIKSQKELDILQHTLKVKQNAVTQFKQLQEQYNDLSVQLQRSEKIRVQQKDLIETLKEEILLLRDENEDLFQKANSRPFQQEKQVLKKKKIKKFQQA